MPLPASWPTVLVHGTYLRLDGTPNAGSVWFETDQPVVVTDATGTVIGVLPKRQIATLDKNGHFEIALPVTDAVATPTGWTYQVSEKFNGGQPDYSIEVPSALIPNGINLAQYPHATPVPVNPPVVTYLRVADIGVTVASEADVQSALSTANSAATQAAAAVTTANAASATATNALTVANAIDGKAQSALDASAAATTTANNALTVANGIAGTANTALANANAAVTTANTANTNANNAVTTANGVDAKAQSALDNSNTAITTANTALANSGKWATPRNLTLTGAITAALNNVDGTANVSAATSITNHAIALSKLDPTGSVGGQFLQSNGPTNDTQWGFPFTFKNKIINGNFDFWQRATSMAAFSNSLYVADRFVDRATGTTIAPARQPFNVGSTETAFPAAFYHSAVVASVAGAGNFAFTEHRIENVANSSGRTMMLTVTARGPAGAKLGIGFSQNFGTGGSPSAGITGISATNVTLTAAFQKFTIPVTFPSIAGKTLGTNANDFYGVEFWYDAGTSNTARSGGIGQQSGTFDIAQVQLEEGSYATPFELRPPQVELALCQRYYEKSYPLVKQPGTSVSRGQPTSVTGPALASNNMSISQPFKVSKRTVPTLTFYDDTGTAAKCSYLNSGVWTDGGTITVAYFHEQGFVALFNGLTSTISQIELNWTVEAEL